MDPPDNPSLHAAAPVLAQQRHQARMRADVQGMGFATMATRPAIKRPPGEGGWDIDLTLWSGLGASDPVGTMPMQAHCDDLVLWNLDRAPR